MAKRNPLSEICITLLENRQLVLYIALSNNYRKAVEILVKNKKALKLIFILNVLN